MNDLDTFLAALIAFYVVAFALGVWWGDRRGFRRGRRFERGYRPLGRGYLRTIGADASVKTPGGGRTW